MRGQQVLPKGRPIRGTTLRGPPGVAYQRVAPVRRWPWWELVPIREYLGSLKEN